MLGLGVGVGHAGDEVGDDAGAGGATAVKRSGSPPARHVGGFHVAVKQVGDDLLSGEIALARGDKKAGIDLLRAAVVSESKVNYAEPPDWGMPVREWLGRALLRDGQFAEAEKTYREEVKRNPRNGRALFGLAEALNKQGKTTAAEFVRRQFEEAWANADTKLAVADLYGNVNTAVR